MSEVKRTHIFYSGSVQGVGFRYTTKSFADELALRGWVKNLADGRVEIIVEGPQESIDKLCQKLEVQFEGYIHQKKIDMEKANGKFDGFEVT